MADDFQGGEDGRSEPGGRRFPPWLIGVIVVGLVSVLFISQNRQRVTVDFILWDRSARTWVVIVISMALGALLAELVRLGLKRRKGSSQ
jgi:uncharacterized integral membrane protein